ncbi:2-amino-4-hydroxy-6-hydroxymethyldihydropteridine diphosphokinase [Caenimonas aquaedulcis]|uniref:2-amino-4-hydroxy-6-hydroxymethyldihydropteridine pyrophosphokinase n=1 Tax=Caenimonas aquaedulcis TaxID=2793270 RepID=A0A931H3E9_9BURK|nr:2-amino-4-hydroxy-6-hydroxymethyldihydropteridine diphosphokinase [Caenimonas aquaedulcis]MBG9387807.1 2-amino-4-hydroxy-6-hydroxymethyldihydropteridine diphosphokinase [Caenimonas aquaedulcis]
MREPVTAYVALGANLGDAARAVRDAFDALSRMPGTSLVRRSSLYRTAPLDSSGPDYINAVAQVSTQLGAHELLAQLQAIEARAGRERPYRNAPRTLDLDLLLYGDSRIATGTLEVPHPRMWERAFVLMPLREIAPDRVTPDQLAAVAGQGVTRL